MFEKFPKNFQLLFSIAKKLKTKQVPSCPYGLCDVVSQRPKGAYSARLVGQNVYREIERDCGNRIQYREKWTPEYR